MRRRDFITAISGVAVLPRTVWAQQPTKTKRFAIVHPSIDINELSVNAGHPGYRALFEQLRRLGYVEGQNVIVDRYSGEGRTDQYDDLVRNVMHTSPDLILMISSPLATKFKAATTTTPLLVVVNDPVSQGLVPSISHPGGNVTGVAVTAGLEVWGKRLSLLLEATPKSSNVCFLTTRLPWEAAIGEAVRLAAAQRGISLTGAVVEGAIDDAAYRRLFVDMKRDRVDALMTLDESVFFPQRQLIVDLAAKYQIPAMYSISFFVEPGGLMTYTYDLAELYRHVAAQADKILRGADPADIPIYQATRYQFSINLKTAKALGLDLPATLLNRADEVVE